MVWNGAQTTKARKIHYVLTENLLPLDASVMLLNAAHTDKTKNKGRLHDV